jgi:hypothetical protein
VIVPTTVTTIGIGIDGVIGMTGEGKERIVGGMTAIVEGGKTEIRRPLGRGHAGRTTHLMMIDAD